jgi:hypothetical protein
MLRCKCGVVIPKLREEFGYDTCVDCSDVRAYVGFNVFPHKTGSDVQLIDPNRPGSAEALRQAKRADRRER